MPTYEPGLGCPSPGCTSAFYRPEQRAQHIRENHPELSSSPTPDMVALAQRAHVSLGDIFSDRRHGTGQYDPTPPPEPRPDAKILQMPKRGKPTVDDLYERHLAWSKANGHEDPESRVALKAHEKSGGLTRSQADKIADLVYLPGGPAWRSHRDDY